MMRGIFGIFLLCLACKQMHPAFEDSELATASEKSCGFIQNSSGQRVSWKGHLPEIFYFSEGVPKDFRKAILKAAQRWNESMGEEMIKIESEIAASTEWKNEGRNIIYWIDKPGVFNNAIIQAKSLVRWSGRSISDVDILVNAVDWAFVSDKNSKGILDLESLLVHEFGHSLGLAHQSSAESVMYSILSLDTKRNIPFEKPDVEDVKCDYQ